MFANRFVTDFYKCSNLENNLYIQKNDSSPRPVRGSKRQKNPDSPRDFLANRVSFYMDDVLPSSNDEVDGSAVDLRYQKSTKKLHHARILIERERSFRVGEKKPVRLSRHSSDVSPSSHPQRLQRNRSVNGSKRSPRRRGSYSGSIERSDSRTLVKSLSYRSTGSGSGNLRREDSTSSSRGLKRSSSRIESCHFQRTSSFKMPHKELHPKERRRRIVVLMVISTFLFLVACSVLAVVVTLTHSSFHRNSYDLPDTAEHLYPRINYTETGK
jgi:hypothetical protein